MTISVEKLPRYRNRAMTSFIIDDARAVTPESARAFIELSRWVEQAGIKGECSAVCGMERTPEGKAIRLDSDYSAEVARASKTHLDTFMEVMTHGALYDFEHDRIFTHGPHECVWLNDRSRPVSEYQQYFENIARIAHAAGFRHSGLTQPGCGCRFCVEYFAANHLHWDGKELNSAATEALLNMAEKGLLAGPVACVFVGVTPQGPADVTVLAERGRFGVYDAPPVVGLHDEDWERPDIYVSSDGKEGRLSEALEQGTKTLIYFAHWGQLYPMKGARFEGFKEVANRLNKHHGDKIVWMRPTEIAAYRHTERFTRLHQEADGFELSIPFEALHELTFRIAGAEGFRLRSPSGVQIASSETIPGAALYNFRPENGKYTLVNAQAVTPRSIAATCA